MSDYLNFFLLIIIICFINLIPCAAEKLQFYSDNNFPPYIYYNNEGKLEGIDFDIITEISKRLNIEIDVELVTWNRLLHATKTGECDGSFALFRNAEREEYAYFIDAAPIHTSTFKLFVLKVNIFKFEKIDDLYGKRIGINLGFTLGDEFENAAATGKFVIDATDKTEDNLKKLLSERIDVFIGNFDVTQYIINNQKLADKVIALEKPLFPPRGAYIVLSKKGKNIEDKKLMTEKFNNALKGMVKDNTYRKIFDKYLK